MQGLGFVSGAGDFWFPCLKDPDPDPGLGSLEKYPSPKPRSSTLAPWEPRNGKPRVGTHQKCYILRSQRLP